LQRAVTRAVRTRQRGGLILLYHRIADPASDPQLLCVAPRNFAEHLETLAKHVELLSLADLVSALQEGALPRRAVALTFDDGYVDNLQTAKPLLETRRVSATVFVATGGLGDKRRYWWDRLERLLLWPGVLPGTLDVRLRDEERRWELGSVAYYDKTAFERHRGWNVLDHDDPTPRHAAYRALHRLFWQRGPAEHEAVLEQIEACHQPLGSGPEPAAGLDTERLRRLAADGLVDVGAHSVSHPRLAALPAEEQRAEISESKRRLEELLGRAVSTFAYPFGSRTDYTDETVRLVREAGFLCACANEAGAVRRGSDPFQLPRVIVRDWSGRELAARLKGWFCA
jgi:peptidoglycan/xylan/chitin deacetylase (PgdA/CDA1 family)